jgi:hypothetical protein
MDVPINLIYVPFEGRAVTLLQKQPPIIAEKGNTPG